MVPGKLDRYMQNSETGPPPYIIHKNKLIIHKKDLNVSLKTIQILEENIGTKILDMSHSNVFCFCFDISRWARETKGKLGLYQTKNLMHSKGNHQQNKIQPTEWENMLANTSDKGLISKIYKELIKLNIKKTNNTI